MKYHFPNISLSLGLNNKQVRSAIRITLSDAGFFPIHDGQKIAAITRSIEENRTDLLISNINLEDGNICDLVHDIRHQEIGVNPFVMTIAIIDAPTSASIKEVIDSGVDDLVIAPISGAQLLSRIEDLSQRNRKYVVTVDYIGPDRRKTDRPDTPGKQKIPLIEVPNIIRSKILGGIESSNLSRNILTATKIVNEQKIERDAFQIEWLAKRIAPQLESGEETKDITRMIARLMFVSEDICTRMKESRYQNTMGLCSTMKELVDKIFSTIDKPDLRDVRYLEKLGTSINQSIIKMG